MSNISETPRPLSPREKLDLRIVNTQNRLDAIASGMSPEPTQDATPCIAEEQLLFLENGYDMEPAITMARTREVVLLETRLHRLGEVLESINGTAIDAVGRVADFSRRQRGHIPAWWKPIRRNTRQIVSEEPRGSLGRRSVRLDVALALLADTQEVPDAIKTATNVVVARSRETVNTLMQQGGAITMQGAVIEGTNSFRLDQSWHEERFNDGQALYLPPSSIIFQDEILADWIGTSHLLVLPPAIAVQYLNGSLVNQVGKTVNMLQTRLDEGVANYVARQYGETRVFGYGGSLPMVIAPDLIATSLLSRAALEATIASREASLPSDSR